jgi:hypothetical protein
VFKSAYGGQTGVKFINIGLAQGTPPHPPKMVNVPNVVGKILRAAMSDIGSAGFSMQTFSTDPVTYPVPDVDTFTVISQSPKGNTSANEHTTVLVGAQAPMLSTTGINKMLIFNQYQQHRKLKVWSFNLNEATWADEGDVEYNASAPLEVDFDTNKTYALYFQDDQLIGCHPSGSAPSEVCIYRGPVGPFVGDKDGTTNSFTIQ